MELKALSKKTFPQLLEENLSYKRNLQQCQIDLSETILILLAFNAMVEKHIELKSILRKMFLMDIYLALVLIRILDFQNI